MMFDLDILRIISNDLKPQAGRILISEPLLFDNIFSRSVVYLIDDVNDSHMGFILNHKSGMKLHEAIDGLKKDNVDLYIGGPVEPDVIHFIHSLGKIKCAEQISDNLYLDGDLDQMRELVNKGIANNSNTKFFLGYSGWSVGQLNEEINNNSWLVACTKPKIIFENESKLWYKALNLVDPRYHVWRNFPINPDMN